MREKGTEDCVVDFVDDRDADGDGFLLDGGDLGRVVFDGVVGRDAGMACVECPEKHFEYALGVSCDGALGVVVDEDVEHVEVLVHSL